MSVLLQDILVTAFSIGAAATLVTRLVTLVRPSRPSASCERCATCAPSRADQAAPRPKATSRRD